LDCNVFLPKATRAADVPPASAPVAADRESPGQRSLPNCPRYVHRYDRHATLRYVPRPAHETPVAEWKRIDIVHEALPRRDRERVVGALKTIKREGSRERLRRGER
jgi:hypothetical protein